MNQSVWPEGGITALIGQARVRGSAGAPGGSPKENLELFSEMGEMDARQPKQQLSGKERVPPSGMKAEIKGVSIYHDRKGWELGTWPPARRTLLRLRSLVSILGFSSSLLVSRCRKASQEWGGAGEAKSQI